MSADLLAIVNVIVVPVICGVISWIWKLDARLYQLNRDVLTRDEFLAEMHGLRAELSDLRKAVKA